MGYWVEIVCDLCGHSGNGLRIEPGENFARRLEQASPLGWQRVRGRDRWMHHICPQHAENFTVLRAAVAVGSDGT